jgi:hypothetical protein
MRTLKLFSIILAMAFSALAADPFLGDWNLSITKSDFGSGPKAKSGTTKYAAVGGEYEYRSETDYGGGKVTRLRSRVRFDSTERNARLDGRPMSFITKKLDEMAYEVVFSEKKTGKELQRFRYTVSPANTLTFLWTKGGETVSKLVYEKK